MNLSIVALGGAIGASLRYLVGLAAVRLSGTGFPWGTLFVNVTGSLAMGLVFALLMRRIELPHGLGLFLMTGILGGFTTFSAFSLETAMMWERGLVAATLSYVAASVTFSIAALFVGLWLGRAIFH